MPVPRSLPLVASLLLLSGCGLGPSGAERGAELAQQQVRAEAEALAEDLRSVAWHQRRVFLEAQVPATEEPGGSHEWDVRRELLASDTLAADDGPGFELVVRIRVHVVPGSTSDWDPPQEATVTRCFRFTVRDQDVSSEPSACPDADPIPVDADVRVPPPPAVHERDRRAVHRFLTRGGTVTDLTRLQARLSRGLSARVDEEDGVTGVAVTARPFGTDCVLGRRDSGGAVSVWHPSQVQTQPGEIGCVPGLAIHPLPPPH